MINPLAFSTDYIKTTLIELQKVSFPTKAQVVQRTFLVLFVIVLFVVLIGAYDAGVTEILKLVLFKG
jgi:preprotein translocase SecE subunit